MKRPPFEAYYAYIFAVLLGYFIADLAIVGIRPAFLPTKPPPARPFQMQQQQMTSINQYAGITSNNIFNSDGKIPPPLSANGSEDTGAPDNEPVLSQLPLQLEGTLVHSDAKKSVASITIKAKNETKSFRIDDEIQGMARITSIERRKVIFENLANHRLEYIEIPKDTELTFGKHQATPTAKTDVQSDGNFDFSMKRSVLNKYISNLGQVLNQARMVPNIIPGTGGSVQGFRFVSIHPGSIYEKLGFKPMDVIKAVNGEPVNSPTKAMELYNALRSDNQISLVVERNGREQTFTYNIND